jgi:type VI secretion system protein ImpM
VTGYFGKVATHGDFVSRRLPPALVSAWDDWLQQCIRASQQQLGVDWLPRYLTSPVWRFAIAPGILSPEGLGGVMMPSVDRVGRYFPLTIAATGAPPLLDWFRQQTAWYDAIEELARTSLGPGFSLARFDAAPELVPGPALEPTLAATGSGWRVALGADVGERVAAVALQGHSLWWTEDSPGSEAWMLVCEGLPQPQMFAGMLDGTCRTPEQKSKSFISGEND